MCVPKRETGGDANEQVKNAAGLLAPPGLMLTNQSPIQRTRAKRNVDSTVGNRLDHLGRLLQRCREIGIKKQPNRILHSEQSGPNGGTLAAIWKILEQARVDFRARKNFARDRPRCVGRAIVYDDQFTLRRNILEIIESEPERVADSGCFVEGGNDD